jgi:surfactin synthase thioesterase subunit
MYKVTLATAAVTGCPNRILFDKAAVLRDNVNGTVNVTVKHTVFAIFGHTLNCIISFNSLCGHYQRQWTVHMTGKR